MISFRPKALPRARADSFRISSRISHKSGRHPSPSRAAAWALAAVSLLALAGCKTEEPAQVETVRPVRTAVATLSAPTRTLVYAGSIKPRYESNLGFRVGGKISERLVNVGDRVAAGAVLARLDPQDLRLAQESARANATAAASRRQVAQAAFERARTLHQKGWTAKAALDQAQLELDSANSTLESALSALRQAENQTAYAELRADAAGVVTGVSAEAGQVVAAGAPVATLARDSEMEVAVSVPEQEIARLEPGQPVAVALWADPGRRIEGRIREIAAAADPATRTYAVRVAARDPKGLMRFGMTATVEANVSGAAPAVLVPLTALTSVDGQPSVWVVDAAGTVSRRPVAVAGPAPEGVRIREGLEPGQQVVSAGVQFLHEGLRVRPEAAALVSAEHRS